MNKNKVSLKNLKVSMLENKIGSNRELDICDYNIKTWREPKYKKERKEVFIQNRIIVSVITERTRMRS